MCGTNKSTPGGRTETLLIFYKVMTIWIISEFWTPAKQQDSRPKTAEGLLQVTAEQAVLQNEAIRQELNTINILDETAESRTNWCHNMKRMDDRKHYQFTPKGTGRGRPCSRWKEQF
jgi:hypothetical protein